MLATFNNGSLVPAAPANRVGYLFERLLRDDFFSPPMTPAVATLPLSVWEDEDNVHVEADAPGVAPEDVELTAHQGVLTLRTERKQQRQGVLYEGRGYGTCERQLTLPCPVNAEGIEAKMANGVLSVTLPKTQESKPKRIAVRGE